MGKDSQEFKQEYKTTREAIGGLSPFRFREQLKVIKSMTPEEYETVMLAINEFKLNMKVYATIGVLTTMSFSYW